MASGGGVGTESVRPGLGDGGRGSRPWLGVSDSYSTLAYSPWGVKYLYNLLYHTLPYLTLTYPADD